MPNRAGITGPPAAYLAAGTWPDGALVDHAPVPVVYARDIAHRLRAALQERTIREVAASSQLARSTLHDLLAGRAWPDVVTLAKLEQVLNVRLWPQ